MTKFYLSILRQIASISVIFLIVLVSIDKSVAQPVLTFTPFATGLGPALEIVNAGDGSNRLFIAQRNGTIRVHDGTTLLPTPFINLADTVLDNGEQGLLSLAFHPDYETNRYFFVWYTDKEGDLTLARYQTTAGDPNIADQNSEVVLLEIPKPGTPYFPNHNGGKIAFGTDGYLYVSIGDGGGSGDPFNNAQNGNLLLGKMLRLNVNNFSTPPYYTIPADNPYVSDPTVRDEIWAMGLRNPWRWSWDRLTNDMWIADVGQNAWEEINIRTAGNTGGVNYGWRCYEGTATFNTSGCLPASSYVSPIFTYPHNNTTGGFSVSGGYVYRGSTYPLLSGYYVCADYVSGNVWKIRPNGSGGWNVFQQSGLPGSIAGFGESENGTLYAASLSGTVYLVEANSSLPLRLIDITAQAKKDLVKINWTTSFEENISLFEIEYSYDGIQFSNAARVIPANNSSGSSYSFDHAINTSKKLFYRLKTSEQNGQISYSKIVVVNGNANKGIIIQPTVITNQLLIIVASEPIESVRLFNSIGKEVYSKTIGGRQGNISIQLPVLIPGTYIVHSRTLSGNQQQKIIIQ